MTRPPLGRREGGAGHPARRGASLNGQASTSASPLGLHRVLEPAGVLPQAAWRLDRGPAIWPDEVRVRVERLNLDAASFRQLTRRTDGRPGQRSGTAVLEIVADARQDAEPGDRLGRHAHRRRGGGRPGSRRWAWRPGDRVATLVSLSLTPLVITDGLARWDGKSEQVPVRRPCDPVRPVDRGAAARPTCPPSWRCR